MKFLVPILFLLSQFLITGYGYFTGKMPTKGALLGFEYDSLYISAFIVQLKYIWVLLIVNYLFTIGFNLGFASFKNYLLIATMSMASVPIAMLLFNYCIAKESVDVPIVVGLLLILIGSVLVVGHREILDLL